MDFYSKIFHSIFDHYILIFSINQAIFSNTRIIHRGFSISTNISYEPAPKNPSNKQEQITLRLRQAIQVLREKGTINHKEYATLLQVSTATATRDLQILLSKKIITVTSK